MAKEKPDSIWITGASSGIGKAAAKEFARTGIKVYASARRVTELERLNAELKKEKLSVEIIPCNVASSANVDHTVKKISSESNIKALINNAGITSFKSASENSVPEINDIININLLGSIYAIKYVLPHLSSAGEGTIINVLSSAVKKIFTHSSAYSASKAGLLAYTNVLREEIRDKNIRVINIIPGATETPMWPADTRKAHSAKMMTPEELARLLVSVFNQKGNLVMEELVVKPITGDL